MLSGRRIVFKLKQFLKQFLGIFFTPKGLKSLSSLIVKSICFLLYKNLIWASASKWTTIIFWAKFSITFINIFIIFSVTF